MTNFIRLVISSCLILSVTVVHSQDRKTKSPPKSLEWNEYYQLDWSDFAGKRTSDAIGDAATVVKIEAKPYYSGKSLHYNVAAIFIRSKSWVSDKSNSLLRHERLHFDIAEIYARRIRKKISELKDQGVRDVKAFNAAIQEILEESNLEDRRYDVETLHGAMSKKQREWELKIKEELIDLEDYKKQRKIISKRK